MKIGKRVMQDLDAQNELTAILNYHDRNRLSDYIEHEIRHCSNGSADAGERALSILHKTVLYQWQQDEAHWEKPLEEALQVLQKTTGLYFLTLDKDLSDKERERGRKPLPTLVETADIDAIVKEAAE